MLLESETPENHVARPAFKAQNRSMHPAPRLLLWVGLALSATSCTLPKRAAPRTPLEALGAARTELDDKDPSRAVRILRNVDETDFRGEDLVRYKVLLGEALLETEEYYDAFKSVLEILTENPTSAWRSQAEYVHFESGRRLAGSGGSFLGILTDLDDAVLVLRNFVTYWPRSSRVPEALRILGEAAFIRRDYETAIHRYTQLVQINASAQLTDLAASRIAMSHYEQIRGHEYDSGQMTRAREELGNYLRRARHPERIEKARQALAQTIRWQEERAMHDARFYLTLGRPKAAIAGLDELLAKADVERRDEVRALRARAQQALERAEREAQIEARAAKSAKSEQAKGSEPGTGDQSGRSAEARR